MVDELYHYGIKGQKWGVRRFQNEDGSYTEEGLKRRLQESGLKGTRSQQNEIKSWSKKQEKIAKKFDKHTEKILSDKRTGKKISNSRIQKAIQLGTEYNKYDSYARDVKGYFNAKENIQKGLQKAPILGGLDAAFNSPKSKEYLESGYKWYAEINNEVINTTISDLKKHGVI